MTTIYYVPQHDEYDAEKDTPRMSLKDTIKNAKDAIEEWKEEEEEDMVGLYAVVIEEMQNGEDWDKTLAQYFVGDRWSEDYECWTARENCMVIHLLKAELQKKYEQVSKVFTKFQANVRGRSVRWEYPLYALSCDYEEVQLGYKISMLVKEEEEVEKKEKEEAENEAYQQAVMDALDSDDEW